MVLKSITIVQLDESKLVLIFNAVGIKRILKLH